MEFLIQMDQLAYTYGILLTVIVKVKRPRCGIYDVSNYLKSLFYEKIKRKKIPTSVTPPLECNCHSSKSCNNNVVQCQQQQLKHTVAFQSRNNSNKRGHNDVKLLHSLMPLTTKYFLKNFQHFPQICPFLKNIQTCTHMKIYPPARFFV